MNIEEIKKDVKNELHKYINKKSINNIENFAIDFVIEETLKAINYSRSCVTPEDRNTQYIEADTIEHEEASNIEVEQLADKEFTDFEKKLSKWKNNTGYIHVWKKS